MPKYNAKDCTITVNGVFITGLGKTMVSGEKDEDNFSTVVGAQGDVVENEINNPLGSITLTVQATSPQKSMLIDFCNSGEHFPAWITNKSIGEQFGGTDCRIKKMPGFEHADEVGDREFDIQVFDYTVRNV